ncbi:hypothetical protein MNEG_6727 [Monoraphidium neglectum]|uniref:Glycosyltransferase family 92 protein n=1 Tax=Monoraphidium neglectum TaxID=145388 RepID=A0A0D2L1N9_9CHLO|nr:hypothetical protein MNEG_6727 [Monoraphidium neglectum]KIZ01239.1 hypothetical protein MNEG_6727 [Monoraphidium neglectum]|eukprot:XP_013900258.1 hypothetical protein MNEG_6727 [Monoraphidium neglectum]
MPVALKAFVPAARAAPSYALRIEGSDYLAVLDAEGGCATPADPLSPGRLPATSWVLLSVPPPWNDDLTTHVLRLREHLEWHRRVGFTGHILYYDPAQATRLARDPAFMQLLGSYRVAVVRWAQFPKVAWLPWDAQGLRLSHAYLALWGWDAGLLPIDVDEFLLLEDSTQHPAAAMPPGSALRALVRHCGGGADGVTFERFAVYCSSGSACPGGDEASVWRAREPPAALAGANASDGGWSWADGDRSGLGPSRLAAYRAVEAVPHVGSKAWSTSACTFPASVHEHRLSGLRGCAHVQARPSCGRLLHAINSFHFRDNWLAPGRAVAPFRHPWWPAVLVARPEAAVGVATGEPEGVAGPAGVGLDALGAAAQVGAGGAAGAAVAQQ